jgi:hypothetical protein
MDHITKRLSEEGRLMDIITLSSVDEMFMNVAQDFQEQDRDGQKKWTTFVHQVHKKKRRRVEAVDETDAD